MESVNLSNPKVDNKNIGPVITTTTTHVTITASHTSPVKSWRKDVESGEQKYAAVLTRQKVDGNKVCDVKPRRCL